MEKCKYCAFWDKYEETCGRFTHEYIGYNKTTNDYASIKYSVCDDTGLDIRFETGPDFGCVQFKKKNNE